MYVLYTVLKLFLSKKVQRNFRTNSNIDFQNKKGFLYLEEGYKYEIAEKAKKALCLKMWNSSMIGTGKIGKYVSDAVSCAENLINFHQIIAFKNKCNPNHSDYNIDVEKVLFDIYANRTEFKD